MNPLIEQHEYNLRQLIDFALTFDINEVYKARTEKENYPFQEYQIINLRPFYDAFNCALIDDLSKLETQFQTAIATELKDRFLPMFYRYYDWFRKHSPETKKFEPYNFYTDLYQVVEWTERDLKNHFPEFQTEYDYSHYLKTGRTPFYLIKIKFSPLDFSNINNFLKVKQLSNEAFERIKSMAKFFESTESKNEMLNNIFELLKEIINKSGTLNYKEYFTSLQNKILALKTEPETSTGIDENLSLDKLKLKTLYEKMNKIYFEMSFNDFIEITKYKRLPNGIKQIKWIDKNMADAYRFRTKLEFTTKQMNDIFIFINGKLRDNRKPKNERTRTNLTKIFKELLI